MQLTLRDVDILRCVAGYRLLTRPQIQRLLFSASGTTSCKRRLTLLYHQGLLGRIALPIRNAYGAARAVYFVERAGIQVLAAHDGEPRSSGRSLNTASEWFLDHELDVADVRIAFELASRELGYAFVWTDEPSLRRAGVRVRLNGGASTAASLVPDGLFTIETHGVVDGFAVEVDRGTVSEMRMRRRFRSYGEWAATADLPSVPRWDSLRVLTLVTASARDRQREERLRRWCEEESGRSLFWFAGRDAVDAENILTAPVWRVAGSTHRVALSLSSSA